MKLSVNEILRFLQKNDIYYEYFGDSNLTIERFCSLNFLKTNSIPCSWLLQQKKNYLI